ncbi:hypothetical protein ZIOFF_064265 [Zingiber officinale]|uniref:Uncharacterized protein n=1 Tax=Zingiber officinale TaxID=94328 RepID=A0A8J5EVZ8_ZINOF|nr:hypothetical protein ZIOFF_064265 [Zingiber officinale]
MTRRVEHFRRTTTGVGRSRDRGDAQSLLRSALPSCDCTGADPSPPLCGARAVTSMPMAHPLISTIRGVDSFRHALATEIPLSIQRHLPCAGQTPRITATEIVVVRVGFVDMNLRGSHCTVVSAMNPRQQASLAESTSKSLDWGGVVISSSPTESYSSYKALVEPSIWVSG